MFRLFGPLLLILPMIAVSAHAQSRYSAPPVYSSAGQTNDEVGLPSPNAWSNPDDTNEQRLLQAQRQYTQAAPAPPASQPAYGHQLDAQPAQPAQPAAKADPDAVRPPGVVGSAPPAGAAPPPVAAAALPPEEQPEVGQPKELAANLRKQLVDYATAEPAGTIIVDTANTYLYLALGGGKAIRYGVRVGRDGFTWTGTERISKMKEWPDWFPPPEMIERQPYLPRMMAGGPGNPLGARAMYLGHTLYRIHGTNQPSTIGHYVSSGCVGMLNDDVEDLFSRVQVGTRVVVLPGKAPENVATNGAPPAPANPMAPPANPMAPPSNNGAAIPGSPLPAIR